MKRVFITGAAGFIGSHTALALKAQGAEVIGYDNFNDYYSIDLKKARTQRLQEKGISVIEGDLCDSTKLEEIFCQNDFTHVLNLAAQAGVRYAQKNPGAYLRSNLEGFLNLLERLKERPHIKLVYASSSSVYGCNAKTPFSVQDATDQPANLYAATKKANELLAYSYHHLHGLTTIGLRYFTVYGPWGRPDMAYFSFTEAILKGEPIRLFNNGQMWRDFTYIDDAVQGTIAALDHSENSIFNLGNNRCEKLLTFVSALEKALGKEAVKIFVEDAPGEMTRTFADISLAQEKLGFQPTISLKEGLDRFVHWHKEYTSGRASVMSEAVTL
jgi:UDP-glucuronate 4-epimerase